MTYLKRIKNGWAVWKEVRNKAPMFKIVLDIFNFVEQTHKEQRPMLCKIVVANMQDGNKIEDFVSLWAGIGDANPIERCRYLKAQNDELKRLLTLYHTQRITTEDKDLVDITLKMFQ
jgi:hypothetical protein